jgi:uncharacterized NAD(P)/FAD-binding protein YdhS
VAEDEQVGRKTFLQERRKDGLKVPTPHFPGSLLSQNSNINDDDSSSPGDSGEGEVLAGPLLQLSIC